MREKRKQLWIGLFFLGFLGWALVQHSYVWPEFDDYGYATLYYARNQSVNGVYTLKNILEYLQWHYMHWGGRILSFFAEIMSLRIGLGFTRVVQSVMVLLSLFLSWRIVRETDRETDGVSLAVLAIAFGLLAKQTVTDGIYWFTASFVYFWPYAVFLAAVFFDRIYRRTGNNRLLPAVWVCFFVAGFSQEQTGFAVVTYTVLSFLLPRIMEGKRKCVSVENVKTVFACAGFALVFLAPGNFVRLDQNEAFNELSLCGKIRQTLPEIINNNFGKYNWRFDVLLALTGILAAFLLYKRIKIVWQKAGVVGLGILQAVFAGYAFLSMQTGSDGNVWFAGIWFAAFAILLLVLLWNQREWTLMAILLSAWATQVVMLISPTITNRTHLVCELLTHIIIAWVWGMASKSVFKKGMPAALTVLAVFALSNMCGILLGYRECSAVHELNHNKLEEAMIRTEAGEQVSAVRLYKLPDDSCVSQMGYQQDFIEIYMREYYRLPANVVFFWADRECRTDLAWDGLDESDGTFGQIVCMKSEQPVECDLTLRLNKAEGAGEQTVRVSNERHEIKSYSLEEGKNEITIHLYKGTNEIKLSFSAAEKSGETKKASGIKWNGWILTADRSAGESI